MISWNATSASAILVISSLSSTPSKSLAACFSLPIPSLSIRSQARRIASSSSAPLTSRTSLRFFSVISATSAPFLGIISTRPSSSSLRIASRIGVRLTPSLLASWISIRRSPGFNSPLKIACLNVLKTTSLSGRYSFIVTSNLGSIFVPPCTMYIRHIYLLCQCLFPNLILRFPCLRLILKQAEYGRSAPAHHGI